MLMGLFNILKFQHFLRKSLRPRWGRWNDAEIQCLKSTASFRTLTSRFNHLFQHKTHSSVTVKSSQHPTQRWLNFNSERNTWYITEREKVKSPRSDMIDVWSHDDKTKPLCCVDGGLQAAEPSLRDQLHFTPYSSTKPGYIKKLLRQTDPSEKLQTPERCYLMITSVSPFSVQIHKYKYWYLHRFWWTGSQLLVRRTFQVTEYSFQTGFRLNVHRMKRNTSSKQRIESECN